MNATLSLLCSLAIASSASADLLAIRVGRAETISQGTIEHAVLLVEDGKIVMVGEDLPIERGIPTVDRPDWVVTPGLVNCYSRLGLDSAAGNMFEPQVRAADELYPLQDVYRDVLETGTTTLGLYPPGTGIPGQALAVRPRGKTLDEMLIADSVYLKIMLESSAKSKKVLREAFEKVDEHDEKVAKALEKWEKAEEKRKKDSKKKKKGDDDDKSAEKGEDDGAKDDGPKEFEPPEPDAKVQPFIELREKRLRAMMRINKAGDYLHLLDVIENEKIDWFLRIPLRNDIDLFKIAERLGEAERLVVTDPSITLMPNTRRERNIPAELARAGVHVALIPRRDSVAGHKDWLQDVGELVARGMDRQAALAAVTLEPARAMGLEERLGSLDPGKDANLVFWNGDPFAPGTKIEAVMLEGAIVHGDVR